MMIESERLISAKPHQDETQIRQLKVEKNQIDSRVLFQSSNTITIVHQAQTYKLTLTKTGKLILTK